MVYSLCSRVCCFAKRINIIFIISCSTFCGKTDKNEPYQNWLFSILVIIPPMFVLYWIKNIIVYSNDYSILSNMIGVVKASYTEGYWARFLLSIFSGLGILPLIAISNPRQMNQFVYYEWHWTLMIVIGVIFLFGGVDKSRLFLYMLPVWVIFAVRIIEEYHVKSRIKLLFYLWLVLTLAIHLYFGFQFNSVGDFKEYLNVMVPMHGPQPFPSGWYRIGLGVGIWSCAAIVFRMLEHGIFEFHKETI
jgi:hypothetical protein